MAWADEEGGWDWRKDGDYVCSECGELTTYSPDGCWVCAQDEAEAEAEEEMAAAWQGEGDTCDT